MTAIRRPEHEACVGIMACETDGYPPFAERQFYARLCRSGMALGLKVYVFSPVRVERFGRLVEGYTFGGEADGWSREMFPLPDLIYDRIFTSNHADQVRYRTAVRRLLSAKPALYLGHGLKGKWEVLKTLRRDPELRPYLPRTEQWSGPDRLLLWLQQKDRVFLKPQHGSHGKGALILEKVDGGYLANGRDMKNRTFHHRFPGSGGMLAWLSRFIGTRLYLIQDYLALTASDGSTCDIRSLVQKNGRGQWELTGMAVRHGHAGSITSNIHGGGTALEVESFLEREFGPAKARTLLETLRDLSARIPPVLEAGSGRLAELGLDLGIDRDGVVWIIEVNSKPGRSVFHRLSQDEAHYRSAHNPIAYAGYLLRRRGVYSPVTIDRAYRTDVMHKF